MTFILLLLFSTGITINQEIKINTLKNKVSDLEVQISKEKVINQELIYSTRIKELHQNEN
jgi:cell division protein FtsL